MAEVLTRRQREVLGFVQRCISERGAPPSMREIAKGLSTSLGNVHGLIARLADRGALRAPEGRFRNIELAGMQPMLPVSLLGRVVAGRPEIAEQQPEGYVQVEAALLKGRRGYALRVVGDSMIGEQIREGDLVIVREQQTANDGDLVVALLNGENTLKKYRRRGKQVILEPANRRYQPIVVKPGRDQDLRIQGKVVQIQRTFR